MLVGMGVGGRGPRVMFRSRVANLVDTLYKADYGPRVGVR